MFVAHIWEQIVVVGEGDNVRSLIASSKVHGSLVPEKGKPGNLTTFAG